MLINQPYACEPNEGSPWMVRKHRSNLWHGYIFIISGRLQGRCNRQSRWCCPRWRWGPRPPIAIGRGRQHNALRHQSWQSGLRLWWTRGRLQYMSFQKIKALKSNKGDFDLGKRNPSMAENWTNEKVTARPKLQASSPLQKRSPWEANFDGFEVQSLQPLFKQMLRKFRSIFYHLPCGRDNCPPCNDWPLMFRSLYQHSDSLSIGLNKFIQLPGFVLWNTWWTQKYKIFCHLPGRAYRKTNTVRRVG